MASKMAKTTRRAAFGSPCQIGCLYDCRYDRLLPDTIIFGESILSKVSKSNTQLSKDPIVSCIETNSEKADVLGLDQQMRLSILAGLCEAKGSAKFLVECDEWYTKGKVGLSYEKLTASENLSEHLYQSLDVSSIAGVSDATHVVVGIEYGAKACMAFSESHQGKSDVSLLNMVQLIPEVDPEESKDMKKINENRLFLKSVDCQIFNDGNTTPGPSTYIDALHYYHDWLKTDVGKGVPIYLILYPLFHMYSGAPKIKNEIRKSTIKKVEAVIEPLTKIKIDCNKLLTKINTSKTFSSFEKRSQQFQERMLAFLSKVKEDIADNVEQIREGTTEEIELIKILKENGNSSFPFSQASLSAWIKRETNDHEFVSDCLSHLEGIQLCRTEKEKRDMLWKSDIKTIIAFTFLRPASDDQLKRMNDYNTSQSITGTNPLDSKTSADKEERKTLTLCKCFRNLYEINKNMKDAAFIIWEESHDHSYPAAKVQIYEDSDCVETDFALITCPGKPDTTPVKCDSLLLCWEPAVGKVSSYEIHYEEEGSKASSSISVTEEAYKGYTLSGLSENASYNVKVRAQTHGGLVGPYSKPSICTTTQNTKTEKEPHNGRFQNHSQMEGNGSQLLTQGSPVARGKPDKTAAPDQVPFSALQSVSGVATGGHDISSSTLPPIRDNAQEDPFTHSGMTGEHHEEAKKRDLKEYLRDNCSSKIVDTESQKEIYKLNLIEEHRDIKSKLKRLTLGKNDYKCEKVIMMVGATGSGKTTLINGLVNILFGVKWEDNFRFKLITEEKSEGNQAKSQTSWITAYTLYHQEGFEFPHTLTLIDTPGFGDTGGIKRDEEITKQMKKFFSNEGSDGIDHLDGVGFVVNSSLPRLTQAQQYIFNHVLSLFGRDVSDKILMLLTFADGKKPPALSALKAAQIKYTEFFKYNNSALYSGGSNTSNADADDEDEFNSMFWKMGAKSNKILLTTLTKTKPTSLVLTNQVLEERDKLACIVEGVRKDIRQGLFTLERLKSEIEMVKKHEALIQQNKDFNYILEEDQIVAEPLPQSQYITNCVICNHTCHDPCGIPNDEDKKGCAAMSDGYCCICKGKCHWQQHKNQRYRYVIKTHTVTKRSDDLFTKYQEAGKKKLTAEGLVQKIFEDFERVQGQVIQSANDMRSSLQRLKKIALRPDAMTTPDYVDTLIDAEQQSHEVGWRERVEHLQALREKLIFIHDVTQGKFEPFMSYKSLLEKMPAKSKSKGIHSRLTKWLGSMIGQR